jgi:hypothetical protein
MRCKTWLVPDVTGLLAIFVPARETSAQPGSGLDLKIIASGMHGKESGLTPIKG